MDAFVLALYSDPLHYIEYAFAFFGALGVILFLMGFSSALPHLFTYGESAHHVAHARVRTLWGLLLCMITLGFWEALRVLMGQVPLGYLWLSIILLTPLWVPWLMKAFKGGGH